MIYGIGTDIVSISRMQTGLEQYGVRFAQRILSPEEWESFSHHSQPAKLLAKRFAAKEAFGKALGTGVAVPATLHALSVLHDAQGKPYFGYNSPLAQHLLSLGLRAQLSLSDEAEFAVAFVLLEYHHV